MPTRKNLSALALTAAISLSLVGCGESHGADVLPPEQARAELINRNWIDRWPEAREDRLHVFRFVPGMGGGVYQDRNVFEGSFELFTFEATGEELRFVFPGRDEQHRSGYRIERVTGPAPFNRRLVLEESPRGPGVFYGYDEGGAHQLEGLDDLEDLEALSTF